MRIDDLELFRRIADTRNISESARQMNITAAAASAALKRLETSLEVSLFIRTTRQLRMTAEGERFLLYCTKALESLNQGKQALHSLRGKVTGSLRLSLPSDFGRNQVQLWLDRLLQAHPELSLRLTIDDSNSDFFLDRIDVALRYGDLPDTTAVAHLITTADRVVCAAPVYLQKFGTPTHPEDLLRHNCLLYQLGHRDFDQWQFEDDHRQYKIKVSGNRKCNDGDLVRRWAVAGKGIAYKSRLDMSPDLLAGNVVEVLKTFRSPPLKLWLVCPTREQFTPAVLILRDMLRQKCAALGQP